MRRYADGRPRGPPASCPGDSPRRRRARRGRGRRAGVRARAVVPQKTLSGAKSRLDGVLSADARAALSLALLRNVCASLRAVAEVEGVVVMTPDAATQARAAAWGLSTLIDPCPGLNAALAQAVRDAARSCAVVIVAADLPLLRPADVAALLAAGERGGL